jgi:competence protein ComEC
VTHGGSALLAPVSLSRSGLEAFLRAVGVVAGVVSWSLGGAAALLVLPPLVCLALGLSRDVIDRPLAPGILARRLLGFLTPWLAVGWCAAGFHAAREPNPLPPASSIAGADGAAHPTLAVRGRLLDWEAIPDDRQALLVRIEAAHPPAASDRGPWRGPRPVARLTVPVFDPAVPPAWRPGDLLQFTARLGPPRNFKNPAAFDYRSSLAARGIDLTGVIKSPRLIDVITTDRIPWLDILPSLRRRIGGSLSRAAGPDHPETASFLTALLIGERDDLPPEIRDPLMKAGVYHIVALSGLNVAIIVSLAALILTLVPLRPSSRRAALALAAILYWVLARQGGSISRAALMAILYLAGALLERRISAIGSVAVTGALLVLHRSCRVWDAGFQLTFAASLALILLGGNAAGARDRRASRRASMLDRLVRAARISAAALAGTILVTAHHFQSIAPVSLLANLVAVPAANLLLLLALGIVGLSWAPPVWAGFLALAASRVLHALTCFASTISSPAWMSFHVVPPGGHVVLGGETAMVLSGALRSKSGRRAAGFVLTAAILWTVLAGLISPPGGRLEVTALDVGQGDAIVLRFPNGLTMLVDAGGFTRSSFDVGERIVGSALRALGQLRLDVLVITHAHHDHLGGAAAIIKDFSPAAIWLGRMPADNPEVARLEHLAESRGIPMVFPRRGVTLAMGGTRIQIFNPGPGSPTTGGASNDDSLVMRITYGRRSALLTGDLEAPLESIVLNQRGEIEGELLKVAHHGSRTSTSPPFLARVNPRVAVISVGGSNPWGHPDPLVLRRLAAAGVEVYRTDVAGAVRFRTDGLAWWRVDRLVPPEEQEIGASTDTESEQE